MQSGWLCKLLHLAPLFAGDCAACMGLYLKGRALNKNVQYGTPEGLPLWTPKPDLVKNIGGSTMTMSISAKPQETSQ